MKKATKIAAIGDIHMRDTPGIYAELFQKISKEADVLVLAGDLTDRGLVSEAELVSKELNYCSIPVVGVLGNHDYENNQQEEIKKILTSDSVTILEGDSVVIHDIGFAGVKGFAGGFDKHLLTPWGEQAIKAFVTEAVNDSLKLENALVRLETEKKVVVMHYSPIRDTVVGEPPEIFPFLGSTRYANVINRFEINCVFHGHAHLGTYEGKTSRNIPVYNVSYHILQRLNNKQPYALIVV